MVQRQDQWEPAVPFNLCHLPVQRQVAFRQRQRRWLPQRRRAPLFLLCWSWDAKTREGPLASSCIALHHNCPVMAPRLYRSLSRQQVCDTGFPRPCCGRSTSGVPVPQTLTAGTPPPFPRTATVTRRVRRPPEAVQDHLGFGRQLWATSAPRVPPLKAFRWQRGHSTWKTNPEKIKG